MEHFFNILRQYKSDSVFNPWSDYDEHNDYDQTAPLIRTNNLKCFLAQRQNAEYLVLGEALGNKGGHFSGIPLTSERIILGKAGNPTIPPSCVCRDYLLGRTSRPDIKKNGYSEATATILWTELYKLKLDTFNFVLWNAFPWHPYNRTVGLLSNRAPTNSEMIAGCEVLSAMLNWFNFKRIIAIGNEAEYLLEKMKISYRKVRHPSRGGKQEFVRQLEEILLGA